MYYTTRIPIFLVYEVYRRAYLISTINSMDHQLKVLHRGPLFVPCSLDCTCDKTAHIKSALCMSACSRHPECTPRSMRWTACNRNPEPHSNMNPMCSGDYDCATRLTPSARPSPMCCEAPWWDVAVAVHPEGSITEKPT